MLVIEGEELIQTCILQIQKPKKVKKQYSGGFRNYGPHPNRSQQSLNSKKSAGPKQLMDYLFQELSVANIGKFYHQGLPPQRQDHKEHIEQAILRLSKPKTVANQNSIRNQDNSQQFSDNSHSEDIEGKKVRSFKNAYQLDGTYEQKAKKALIQKLKQIQEHLLRKAYNHAKKCNQKDNFNIAMLEFIFYKVQEFKQSDCVFTPQKLQTLFKNFLTNSQLEKHLPKRTKSLLTSQQLEQIGRRSLFLFCFLRISQLSGNQENMSFEWILEQHIGQKGLLEPNQQIIGQFSSPKRFTVPYNSSQYGIKKIYESEVLEQPKHIYRANPIPKTLYERPKQNLKKQFHKTQFDPFSFTNKQGKKITPEQYYHWDTNFKANKVPSSTYKTKNELYNQEIDKKMIHQRAHQKLRQASYPQSMKYLENYKQFEENRKSKIEAKYQRPQSAIQSRDIPNFNRYHAINILQLEETKALNKKEIKVVPFNFHQNKRSKPNINAIFQLRQQQQMLKARPKTRPKQSDPPPVKTTMKFQAYVDFRKRGQDKKIANQRKMNQQKYIHSVKYEPLKGILLNRIKDQLHNTEEKHKLPQKGGQNQTNMTKLNLEQVYYQTPLLMESKGTNNKQMDFTSLFEPII